MSNTTIANVPHAKSADKKENEFGLLKVLCTDNLSHSMLEWTNTHCDQVGETQVTKTDLDTFAGLEMAMALSKEDTIKDNCPQNPSSGIMILACNHGAASDFQFDQAHKYSHHVLRDFLSYNMKVFTHDPEHDPDHDSYPFPHSIPNT